MVEFDRDISLVSPISTYLQVSERGGVEWGNRNQLKSALAGEPISDPAKDGSPKELLR